jgi:hypothetical protein
VDHEVEPVPLLSDGREQRIKARRIGDVAGQDQRGADAFGQRPDPLGQRIALKGQGQLRAMPGDRPGDAPGKRAFVGDPEDQPLLARHQRHGLRHERDSDDAGRSGRHPSDSR